MEVHNQLGGRFSGIVYKDTLEINRPNKIKYPFDREKKFEIEYKGIILPHSFMPIL